MQKEQFERMLSLRDTFRDEANALFREYRTMRQQIIGPEELKPTRGNDYYYEPTNFEDDLPSLPICDEWEEEQPKQTMWERMMEHCELKFTCYLGYECEYNSYKLPLRWLFDSNWKDAAKQSLDAEAAAIKATIERKREHWQQKELADLKRLQEKYANNA